MVFRLGLFDGGNCGWLAAPRPRIRWKNRKEATKEGRGKLAAVVRNFRRIADCAQVSTMFNRMQDLMFPRMGVDQVRAYATISGMRGALFLQSSQRDSRSRDAKRELSSSRRIRTPQ